MPEKTIQKNEEGPKRTIGTDAGGLKKEVRRDTQAQEPEKAHVEERQSNETGWGEFPRRKSKGVGWS